jgi:hypothetical protein
MNARKQHLLSVVEIFASLVRTIQSRRSFHAVSPTPDLVMWCVIYGNLTEIAVSEWCKLFGSDTEQNQPVHWKNIVYDSEQFPRDLFSTLGIYESKWRSYWNEMKRYRDQVIDHHDRRRVRIKNYLQFDLALESAYLYYAFVRLDLITRHGNRRIRRGHQRYGWRKGFRYCGSPSTNRQRKNGC